MKRFVCLIVAAIFAVVCSGCGETLRGVGKDCKRVGRGVKTIFVSD